MFHKLLKTKLQEKKDSSADNKLSSVNKKPSRTDNNLNSADNNLSSADNHLSWADNKTSSQMRLELSAHKLQIAASDFNDQDVEKIINLLQQEKDLSIMKLTIDYCEPKNIRNLSIVLSHPSLAHVIDFSISTSYDDEVWYALFKEIHSKMNINYLNLNYLSLSNAASDALQKFLNEHKGSIALNLKSLSAEEEPKILEKFFASLSGNQSIKSLTIDTVWIEDEAGIALARVLPTMKNIKYFSLDTISGMGLDGYLQLFESLTLCKIESLRLRLASPHEWSFGSRIKSRQQNDKDYNLYTDALIAMLNQSQQLKQLELAYISELSAENSLSILDFVKEKKISTFKNVSEFNFILNNLTVYNQYYEWRINSKEFGFFELLTEIEKVREKIIKKQKENVVLSEPRISGPTYRF